MINEAKVTSNDFRISAEFFSKQFTSSNKYISKYNTIKLNCIADVADGDHSKFPEDNHKEVRYLQARDIVNNFLEISSNAFVSKAYFEKNKRSIIIGETILLSIMGNVGDVAITPKNFVSCMGNRALAIIRNIKNLSPQYVFIYLTTKNGFDTIERLKNGGVQQRINLNVLRDLDIPTLSNNFQKQIESVVLSSSHKRGLSKSLYTSAETLLLETLGLKDFTPSNEKFNIKSFKESFGATGRLDAEYYQRKYEDYEHRILTYKNGWGLVNKICTLKTFNYTPAKESTYNYIELSDIDNSGNITNYITEMGKNLPSRARRKVQTNDVLISSIEGSLSSCAIVPKKLENSLCSTGFFVINSKQINSETLLTLFKCQQMQDALKQKCSGTILTAINKADFLNIPLPLIIHNIQIKISHLIQESFKLRTESNRLLNVAKQAVEIAIEQNESTSMRFLQNEINDSK